MLGRAYGKVRLKCDIDGRRSAISRTLPLISMATLAIAPHDPRCAERGGGGNQTPTTLTTASAGEGTELLGLPMAAYVPIEYPKWIGDVVVQNAAEELAHRTALAEAAAAGRAEELARPPSPAAVRMRRTRTRRREGMRTIRCDISAAHIEALGRAGFLDPGKRDEASEVARGVGRLMDQVARSVQGTRLGALAETAA